MAKSYYAVKKGRQTGIFNSWDECQVVIKNYSGAEYKGFNTMEEAEAFMNGVSVATAQSQKIVIQKPMFENEVQIYSDGSFKDNTVSLGLVLRTHYKDLKFYGMVESTQYNSLRNIAGELFAVLAGVELACQLGLTNISVYYDYEGVEKWYTGEWSAKSDLAIKYVGLLRNLVAQNNLNIKFFKVVGHSSVEGNVLADKMASRARTFHETIDINEILKGTLTLEKTPTYRGF